MLDPKLLQDKDSLQKMISDRAADFDLDKLLKADINRRQMIQQADELRKKRNDIGVQIAETKKSRGDPAPLLAEIKSISQEIEYAESRQKDADRVYDGMARAIPNVIDRSVPRGPDESYNIEIRQWRDVHKRDFELKDHASVALENDLLDLERAAKVSGSRFYYLKNDMVKLNQALINYGLDFLQERQYTLIQPPYMINRASMDGAVIAEDFEDVIYKIEGNDLYMIGTSEHALAAMHSDEILDGSKLPIRYAGISPCFRKEAGAHGKDQKGIFRVHQFEKIEQFVFARPEESWDEHEKMISLAEEFYRSLGMSYRVMLLSSGDMGKVSAKTYDIEAWMARQNAFREIVSCSNCLEYQARRLKIRYRDRTNDPTSYAHTLNGTLVATSRVMAVVLENFQRKDGHVDVPQVLRRYLGKDAI